MALEDDSFLGRWSRRKHAARRGEALPEPVPAAQPEQPAATVPPAPPVTETTAAPAPAELPPVDSLQGLESEYQEFLRPGVDPATRNAALKKLFSDPHFHFEQMDRLDTYIDDYTKPDPIPAALLKALSQARSLGLFEEEEKAKREGTAETAAAQPGIAAIEPPTTVTPEPSRESPDEVPAKTTGA